MKSGFKETNTGDVQCPYCMKNNEMASHLTGPSPEKIEGSCSLCIGCGEIGIFERGAMGKLFVRKPSIDESAQIESDPRVALIRCCYAKMKAEMDG